MPRNSIQDVEIARVASADDMIKRQGTYVATPRRVYTESVRAFDPKTGDLLFAFVKRAVPETALASIPRTCRESTNRMNAAGPANGRSGPSTIKTADGRTRSRPVKSHTIGYNRVGNLSSWTRNHETAASSMRPVFQKMLKVYERTESRAYATQERNVTKKYLGLPFTSAALNCNLRTGLHKDRNDLEGTMGVMLVAGDDDVVGHELVFPEYGVGIDVRAGDVLVFDSRLWHGNGRAKNPRSHKYDRRSLVMYAR